MRMISAIVLAALSTAALANTSKLTSYDELVQALKQGDDVSAIINFDNCTAQDANKATPWKGASARLNFDVFNHYQLRDSSDKNHFTVATSKSMFIEHATLGPVIFYGRIRVMDDNSVKVYTAMFEPKTLEKKVSVDFLCHLGKDTESLLLVARD